ncbi:MAG: glycosyltransferase family 87 protein [Terracidiphilus sp.]|jgi:hypothetical protein
MVSTKVIPEPEAKADFADFTIVGVAAVALAFTTLLLCVMPLSNFAGGRDFAIYWATGQQLAHHVDPYDKFGMARTERAAGLPESAGVLYMRNPPWDLPLALPLGWVNIKIGSLAWSLTLGVCLVVSTLLLWGLHGRPRNCLLWLGISFAPALLCLLMGQTSLFALLGYVLFLRLHNRHPFFAGVSLWLCAMKPQLFLPFGVVLVAWILVSRSYRIVAGTATAWAASCVVAYSIDPTAWHDYARMMHAADIQRDHIPCLSVALRFWLAPQISWISYLPALVACVWALGYFWQRHRRWNWMKDGSLLMLISVATAPYAWVYDDSLAIPSLLNGAYRTRSRIMLAILPLGSVAMNVELFCGIKISTSFLLWTAPVWLSWYLIATRILGCPSPSNQMADGMN